MKINDSDMRMFKSYEEIRVKCDRCGHTNSIPVQIDEKFCWYCKKKLNNNTKAHFKYKLREELKK